MERYKDTSVTSSQFNMCMKVTLVKERLVQLVNVESMLLDLPIKFTIKISKTHTKEVDDIIKHRFSFRKNYLWGFFTRKK